MEVRTLNSLWNVVSKFVDRGMDPVGHIESFLVNVSQFLEGGSVGGHDTFYLLQLCQSLDRFSAEGREGVPPELLERVNRASSEIRKLLSVGE